MKKTSGPVVFMDTFYRKCQGEVAPGLLNLFEDPEEEHGLELL